MKSILQNVAENLPEAYIVTSPRAGDGKTHQIHHHMKWQQLKGREVKKVSICWGGPQTRADCANTLKRAVSLDHYQCKLKLHLELHTFEDNRVLDMNQLLIELLLFGSIFNPATSSWVLLPTDALIFIEVANTLVLHNNLPLLLLHAPFLEMLPRQLNVNGEEPLDFEEFSDYDSIAIDPRSNVNLFALAGQMMCDFL